MIPLRDTIPSQSFPLVTLTCIGLNVLVFLYELELGTGLERFFALYGFVPAHYLSISETEPWNLLTRFGPMFSSMFVHGGWLHLIGNMWILWIFGDNVEDRLGKGRYLAYYLGCGVAATYLHYLTGPYSHIPVVGASGAIAGVMGGYFVLFPHARVVTLIPIFFFFQVISVPAVVFLALWFLFQFVNGLTASTVNMGGGVAWWAHVGGFAAGALLLLPLRRSQPRYEFP